VPLAAALLAEKMLLSDPMLPLAAGLLAERVLLSDPMLVSAAAASTVVYVAVGHCFRHACYDFVHVGCLC
jgi:hypothetical protein